MRTNYDKDLYKWTQEQTAFLRNREYMKLDFENIIEELESVGRSERDKLESFITLLLMHMLKIKYQPEKHTRSWDLTIKNSKHKAKKVLKENPSLKSKLNDIFKDAYFSARLDAAIDTNLDEKIFPKSCPWTIEEVL